MAGAPRRNRGTLSNADPLWSKAPLVLLRYPGLFVSIAVGALLLALAASAYPLFISSSASELVAARIHDPAYTRWAVGMMYRNGALPLPGPVRHGDIEPRVDAILEGLVSSSPYLGDPLESALGPVTPISVAGEHERRDTRLFMGEQAADHVVILEGSARDGDPGPGPHLGRPRHHAGRGDRDRLARPGNGDAAGRRDLPVAVQGRGLRVLAALERRARPVLRQLRATSPGADRAEGPVRRCGARDRARPRGVRVAGAPAARPHAPGGGGRGPHHLAHLRGDRRPVAARSLLHLVLLQRQIGSRVGELDGRRGPGRPRAARRDRRARAAAADRRDARRAGGRRGRGGVRDGRASRRVEPAVRTGRETEGGGWAFGARGRDPLRDRRGARLGPRVRARAVGGSERRAGRILVGARRRGPPEPRGSSPSRRSRSSRPSRSCASPSTIAAGCASWVPSRGSWS